MMPFYMTFPYSDLEKDLERVKEFYPKEVMILQEAVESRCDELEFFGSRMFDEEPDRLMMQLEARNIVKKVMSDQKEAKDSQESGFLCALAGVLLAHEVCKRRCRYRRYRRWW